jgi:DNA-3-methyladenine glycosylase II
MHKKSKSHKAIRHLKKADSVLAAVIAKAKLEPLPLHKDYFETLAVAIMNQQLSTKAAATIVARFVALFGKRRKFPSPQKVLKMSVMKIRSAGLSGAKAFYIKGLANFFIKRRAELKNISALGDEEIIALLTEVKGIGIWSAEMFLIFALGRDDIFSHGDFGLRKAIRKLYGLRKEPSFSKTKKISAAWKPYRSHASRYLWASLDFKD